MRGTAIAICVLMLLSSGSLSGATLRVPTQYATIQAAIDTSNAGDTILVEPGTYNGSGNRDIDFLGKAILVSSSSGAAATFIDCGGSESEYHRGFYFHSGEDTTSVLKGFTITNGYSERGGAICCIGSSPKILGNVVTGNYAHGGGGIYCKGTHSVISGNIISNNEAPIVSQVAGDGIVAGRFGVWPIEAAELFGAVGGNILCAGDSSLIELNTITGGRGSPGSALSCSGSIIIRDNTISGNGGPQMAGTACCRHGSFTIERNTISGNGVWGPGGGLYCEYGEFRIVGNTISHNGTTCGQFVTEGGGLYCGWGNYTIEDNDITGNRGSHGNGIYFEGSGSIRNNTISGNYCAGDKVSEGGGIAIGGSGSLIVASNIIAGNSAQLGGGISCGNSSAEIIDNVISSNRAFYNENTIVSPPAGGLGGGIYCSSSSPIIARNTIVSNSVSGYHREEISAADPAGAGIFCTQASSPTIHQNIIADNHVEYAGIAGGGGIFCEDSTSVPSISCCDVHGNTNANYGGTLADQTGLNGNFSLDPIFCDAVNRDYELHILSPCLAGHHPDGGDCGLIGALGAACDYVATLLQGYSTSISPSAVTITWTLSQAGENLTCSVLRAEAGDGEYRELLASGITTGGLSFTFNDATFDPGTAYRYRIDVSDNEGRKVLFETSQIVTPALPLSLYQNFPNPFNPSTTISYYLPQDSPVTLAVYDVSGRRIAHLIGKPEKKGRHAVTWNGKDEAGSLVASGMYFYRLTVGKETISKKMVLLR